jgi:hypothetical protein
LKTPEQVHAMFGKPLEEEEVWQNRLNEQHQKQVFLLVLALVFVYSVFSLVVSNRTSTSIVNFLNPEGRGKTNRFLSVHLDVGAWIYDSL